METETKPEANLTLLDNPFLDKKTGEMVLQLKPIRDVICIWNPEPTTFGTTGIASTLFIPEHWRKNHKRNEGIVIAVGRGHFHKEKRRIIPTTLKPGQRVIYNKDVPWSIKTEALDGKEYKIVLCGEQDVWCVIDKLSIES